MSIYQGNKQISNNVTIVQGVTIDDNSTDNDVVWSANKVSSIKQYITIPLMAFTSQISASSSKEIFWDNTQVFKQYVPSGTVTRWRYILTGISTENGTITIGNTSISLINDQCGIGAAYPHISGWVTEHMNALVILKPSITFYPHILSLQIEYINS